MDLVELKKMKERRKFVRIPERAKIAYRVVPKAKIKRFISKDISQGGVRFFTQDFIPEGTFLEIRITLEKITFSFEGYVEVVWSREYPKKEKCEIGAQFINISRGAKKELIHYIKDILKNK